VDYRLTGGLFNVVDYAPCPH